MSPETQNTPEGKSKAVLRENWNLPKAHTLVSCDYLVSCMHNVCLSLQHNIIISKRKEENLTFASGSSAPGFGGCCLNSRTASIMCSLSSMSPAFFWIWLARDSNLVMDWIRRRVGGGGGGGGGGGWRMEEGRGKDVGVEGEGGRSGGRRGEEWRGEGGRSGGEKGVGIEGG